MESSSEVQVASLPMQQNLSSTATTADAPNVQCLLPSNAPSWLQSLSTDDRYVYRDIRKLMPTDGHLIHDALHNEHCIETMYYFIEKVDQYETKENLIQQALQQEESAIDKHQNEEKQQSPSASSPVHILHSPKHVAAIQPSSTTTTNNSTFTDGAATVPTPEVRVGVFLGQKLCGHRKIVHGGLSAALMDEISGACAFITFGPGVFTANLNVNYLKPLPALTWVDIKARATKMECRKTWLNVTIENGEGEVYAQATVLFVLPKWMSEAQSKASS